MQTIYVVVKCECSEMSFCTPTILGVFTLKKMAEECRKTNILNISDNYKINIIKSFIQNESPYTEIPVDVISGYTVA